ncbi:MAG: N-acetylglucosaminyl transferase-like protein [Myxococcales bacterium]|nr:N-acetylglucosaminyl transferase-like protein [Myxococcales bacterium]
MGAALVLLLVGLGALAAGVLIGRYYVPDDRQLRRTARHGRAYMRALSHLIARDHETVIDELRTVVEENVEDVEPYFALGAMFRSRGELERAIRVHQALALRERDKRKLRQRAMYELGLDFRAAGMPRRATRAMEEVLLEDPGHEGGLRALAALYEEQARFNEAAGLWQRLGRRRNEDTTVREHHLLVAAAQAALGRDDLDSAKQLLKAAQKHQESAHFFAAAAELAAARGNHRGVRERLKQALVADPALVPHVLPGLISAEEALAAGERGSKAVTRRDELDDDQRTPELSSSQLTIAPTTALATTDAAALAAGSGAKTSLDTPPHGLPLVPDRRPGETVTDRVLALLAEVEAETGPRLELSLIRSQLAQAATGAVQAELARELATKFPEALAARVAAARLALVNADAATTRQALEVLVGEQGTLAWALRGRWQCAHCGHRPGPFSWRCGQCRRWNTLRMETGVEPPPVAPRDRRASPRSARPEGLLGVTPDVSLPTPTLDAGLSEEELARAGSRRSLLGRVGGWFSGAWRRSP